jgi:3',5'-cyclic-AMP phosphodiesterase
MQFYIVYISALLLITAAAAGAISFYLGRYVYVTEELKSIPFIGNQENRDWLLEQQPAESFSFSVIGDIQAGYRNLGRILNPSPKPHAFAVQTGDLVSHADQGHYCLALHELKKSDLQSPLFIVPGNHDVKGNPGLFDIYFRMKQFYYVWSECLFIFLDNSLGAPYDGLFQFLEETLKEHQGKLRWTFIFIHRPPIDWEHGEPRPELKNYTRFFEIQKSYTIDYVFSGHLHDYRAYELDGTRYISNGLESDQKGRIANESYYTVVHVSPDQVLTEKVRLHASSVEAVTGIALDCAVAHAYPILQKIFSS